MTEHSLPVRAYLAVEQAVIDAASLAFATVTSIQVSPVENLGLKLQRESYGKPPRERVTWLERASRAREMEERTQNSDHGSRKER